MIKYCIQYWTGDKNEIIENRTDEGGNLMSNTINFQEIITLLVEVQGESEESKEITEDSRLIEDLDFDSFDFMELLSEIENRFGVDFTELDDFANKINVCKDLYKGIQDLLDGKLVANNGVL